MKIFALSPGRASVAVLCSRYVRTRPPLVRRQRDQDRLRHSGREALAEFRGQPERGADRSAAEERPAKARVPITRLGEGAFDRRR